MLTFSGQGYTPAFSENFRRILAQISKGADIVLVSGPDDVCRPMLGGESPAHCRNQSVRARDDRAFQAIKDQLVPDLTFGNGFRLDEAAVGRLRVSFKSGSIREACEGCQWFDLCSKIADDNYSDCVL